MDTVSFGQFWSPDEVPFRTNGDSSSYEAHSSHALWRKGWLGHNPAIPYESSGFAAIFHTFAGMRGKVSFPAVA